MVYSKNYKHKETLHNPEGASPRDYVMLLKDYVMLLRDYVMVLSVYFGNR